MDNRREGKIQAGHKDGGPGTVAPSELPQQSEGEDHRGGHTETGTGVHCQAGELLLPVQASVETPAVAGLVHCFSGMSQNLFLNRSQDQSEHQPPPMILKIQNVCGSPAFLLLSSHLRFCTEDKTKCLKLI